MERLTLSLRIGYIGAFKWVQDRQNGKPLEPGCKVVNVSVNSLGTLLPGEATLYLSGIIQVIGAIFGAKIQGPETPAA